MSPKSGAEEPGAEPLRPGLDAARPAAAVAEPTGPLVVAEHVPPVPGLRAVRLSVVLPTYNESRSLEPLLERLTGELHGKVPGGYELVVVDDDSPDGTWRLADRLAERYDSLRVLRRRQERGLATAVVRGWQVARGEILGVLDADLQHPPDVLPRLLEAVEQGADLAVASRHVAGGGVSDWSLGRRLLSRGAQAAGLLLLPGVLGRVSDPMSGYFLLRRSAVAGRELRPLGYKILIEVLARGQIGSIREVGYVFQERQDGQSKVTWRQYVDYLRQLLRLRLGRFGRTSRRPARS